MDGLSSISAIDQKMAEMRIKNLELLKRHQEIEEDRQLAQQSGAITKTIATTAIESTKNAAIITTNMQTVMKNRERNTTNQQNFHENLHEWMHRPPLRRKFDNDHRNDAQPQRTQRMDHNRLKRERTQTNNNNNSISPELLEYAYPFYYPSDNNYANRIGSGRFNQQQRSQEQGQRRREERMRRSIVNDNEHPGGPSEFHLDVPQMTIWQNGSISSPLPPSVHVQLVPTNMNGHHTGIDHLMNNGTDQLDQSGYLPNFIYPSTTQSSPYNGNGPVYFVHPPPPMSTGPLSAQPLQTHYHQYHPTRTFENSNRHQFHHTPHFQSAPVFQSPPPISPSQQSSTIPSSVNNGHQQQEDSSADLPPRFRRLKKLDHDNKYVQQRPMSGDFEHSYNSSSSRFNNDNRFQSRPQSFYDFSCQQQSNNNFFRSSNNNRYQRNNNNNNNSLPLSAYMNTNDSSYQNENMNNNNYWNTSHQKRRSTQHRTYHYDKHQFPLSSYDPRQYGFNTNYQKRYDSNNRSNSNRHNTNNMSINDANDIDLIEEWWEDDNTELIGTQQPIANSDTQTIATINDSGNSSLSTSMHLKESTLEDEDNNASTHDFTSLQSDVSTTDSNIIESLDQLQQQLKLEEDVETKLASENDNFEKELESLNIEPTTYDTAHFMQWAKEKFREELAGRLTAQEIEQHDAATTDDDDDDEIDIIRTNNIKIEKFNDDQMTDDENDNFIENLDEFEDDLIKKLTIKENPNQSISVE